MCRLELSKAPMHKCHYGYIKSKYGSKSLFTDTDSLVYDIETENFYSNFS